MRKYDSFEELMEEAKVLEAHLDTDWAEEHADRYDEFDDAVKAAYDNGDISGKQFNELVLTAFYDYFDDLKDEDEDEEVRI